MITKAVIALLCYSAVICDIHVIVTCRSVTFARLQVGAADLHALNTVRVRVRVQGQGLSRLSRAVTDAVAE